MTPDILNETEMTAVRRRYDGRARRWGVSCSIVFGFVSFMTFVTAFVDVKYRGIRLVCGWAEVIVSVGILALLLPLELRHRKGEPLPRYANAVRPIVIVYFVAMYALILASSGGQGTWIAWAAIVPLIAIGFRFFSGELVILHVLLAVVVTVYCQFVWMPKKASQRRAAYISIAIFHIAALALGYAGARAMRADVTALWRERRDAALEQLRMRDELELAREVQLSMLPEAPPDIAWVDLAGASLPASEVGGDYFDYFTVRDALAIVCGDVAGHGLASGIVLSALRSGFILLRDALGNPSEVLTRLNTMLIDSSRRRTLVTAAILLLDRDTRRATVTSAGHPPVIVRRASGTTDTIEVFGPPLGARLPHTIEQRVTPFASGDVFVMHTDGIHESRNASGDAYGMERLIATIASATAPDAAALRDALLRDAESFRAGTPQADDVTVVVAKIR